MKAWQYTSASGGIEKHLHMNDKAPIPVPTNTEILVQVHAASINPFDYKVTENPMIPLRALGSGPFIPGSDFCGKVAKVGKNVSEFKVGESVFGFKTTDLPKGTLAQYVAVPKDAAVRLPDGVSIEEAAAVGIAGLTELQAIKPHVKSGDRVFVNGGSGGTGVYGVQIAKALGCHVTTTCSTPNVALCKSLGADVVIDYKTSSVVKALAESKPFALVVDNIGNPSNLYKASTSYIAPRGKFVQIGMSPSLSGMKQIAGNMLVPGFLGGGKAKYEMLIGKMALSDLEQLAVWMKEGKLRGIVAEENVFEWGDAKRAYELIKTGRTKGKIVVRVPVEKE
jgi:alkaline phosphatase D